MKKTIKLIFSRASVGLVVGLCLFVMTYHIYQGRQIQKAMDEHARIVAGSLWDLNSKGSEEYLRAVAMLNSYEYIIVKDDGGNKFIEVKSLKVNPFERQLIKLKLIPRKQVFANVHYDNELLGTVEALWLDKSIYAYAYAFLIGLLLFVVIQLYRRILRANATLEKKVEERTRDLTEKTDELQESEQKIRAIFNQSREFIGVVV
jgi:hypothetical protein